MRVKTILPEKIKEAAGSVLPLALIVALLSLMAVPVPSGLMLAFIVAAAMLVAGMGLFTLGTDASMTPIGTHIGARITKTRSVPLITALSFLLGAAITIAEPDLQVLAVSVPHIDTWLLMLTVSAGVGFFLATSMLRILYGVELRWLLLGFYALVFILAGMSDAGFLSVAFDSGGVTTGPMTVPFIMAMGAGVASIRSDRNAESDSFGLVGLCSIGPVLAVLLLGFINPGAGGASQAQALPSWGDTVELGASYISSLPHYLLETGMALAPIVIIFLIFQAACLHLRRLPFTKIIIGVLYTYAGLTLFLAGVNVGFSPLGTYLGSALASGGARWALAPIAMLLGWFIIRAEPAVHVLNRQVEEMSSGAISARAMGLSLSLAVALGNGLALVRVLTGINILWFLLPGYAIALALSFFVPKLFTAIAFDSGGVASGPMTAAFMLPLAMGASEALGGNVMTDAFGLVAMVAMTPLITVQAMGAAYKLRERRMERQEAELAAAADAAGEDVIELWGAAS